MSAIRGALAVTLATLVGAGCTPSEPTPFAAPEPGGAVRPNVLFILADDLGYGDLGWPEPEATYAAMVRHLDRSVGRLLDILDELELADDTVVFFASDNGAR